MIRSPCKRSRVQGLVPPSSSYLLKKKAAFCLADYNGLLRRGIGGRPSLPDAHIGCGSGFCKNEVPSGISSHLVKGIYSARMSSSGGGCICASTLLSKTK